MLNPVSKWVVKVQKSYINLCFEFNTSEGAHDFYEVLRSAYVEDKEDKKISVQICAEFKEDKGENE